MDPNEGDYALAHLMIAEFFGDETDEEAVARVLADYRIRESIPLVVVLPKEEK